MPARIRKLVGSIAILAFLLFYVGLAAMIGALLPDNWILKLLFYGVAGMAWGLPLIPLISWMNKGP